MSDGKSYQVKKVLSDSERLDELDRKFSVIQERIQVYDRIVEENRALTKRFNDLADKPKEIHERITSNISQTNGSLKAHMEMISDVIRANDDLRKAIKGLEVTLSHVQDTHISNIKFYEKSLNELENRFIAYCNGKMDGKEFQEFKDKYFRDFAHQLEERNKITLHVAECKSGILDLNQTLSDAKSVVNEQGKGITGVKLWINSFEDKINAIVSDKFSDFQSKQSTAYDKLRDEVQSNKKEILGTPMSNASVERRISNQLEMASLDASNAVAISKNHTEQIKILEKKIEALNAQITRYEIQ